MNFDDSWNQKCCITENGYKNIIYMRIRMKRFNPKSKLCTLHDFDLVFFFALFVPTVHFYAIIPKTVLLLFFDITFSQGFLLYSSRCILS